MTIKKAILRTLIFYSFFLYGLIFLAACSSNSKSKISIGFEIFDSFLNSQFVKNKLNQDYPLEFIVSNSDDKKSYSYTLKFKQANENEYYLFGVVVAKAGVFLNADEYIPQRCIKKMEKTSPNVMSFESKANIDLIPGINQRYIPGSVRFFSIFFPLRESRRTPDPALPRDRNSRLWLHPRRLGSEALRLLQRWGIPEKKNSDSSLNEVNFPKIGKRAKRETGFFGPGGSSHGLVFTTTDGLYDVKIVISMLLPENVDSPDIDIRQAARTISNTYDEHQQKN